MRLPKKQQQNTCVYVTTRLLPRLMHTTVKNLIDFYFPCMTPFCSKNNISTPMMLPAMYVFRIFSADEHKILYRNKHFEYFPYFLLARHRWWCICRILNNLRATAIQLLCRWRRLCVVYVVHIKMTQSTSSDMMAYDGLYKLFRLLHLTRVIIYAFQFQPFFFSLPSHFGSLCIDRTQRIHIRSAQFSSQFVPEHDMIASRFSVLYMRTANDLSHFQCPEEILRTFFPFECHRFFFFIKLNKLNENFYMTFLCHFFGNEVNQHISVWHQ